MSFYPSFYNAEDAADETPCKIGAFEIRCAYRRAWLMVHVYGFPESDLEDMAQEALLRLYLSIKNFSEDWPSWKVFVRTVVKFASLTMIGDRTRGKRDYRMNAALTMEPSVGDDQELHDLRMDVDECLESVPEEHREVLLRLKVEGTSEAARSVGKPRATVQRIADSYRTAFENAFPGKKDVGFFELDEQPVVAVAQLLDTSRGTILKNIKKGRLVSRFENGEHWVSTESVKELMESEHYKKWKVIKAGPQIDLSKSGTVFSKTELSVGEIADFMGIPASSVRRYIRIGRLPSRQESGRHSVCSIDLRNFLIAEGFLNESDLPTSLSGRAAA